MYEPGLRFFLLFLLLIPIVGGCTSPTQQPTVVVYTSVDQPYAEPIFAHFQEQTGIQVKAIYDVEATKTTGLVNRLIAEAKRPQADVFWNNEIVQTIHLQLNQILQPYLSPQAEEIPAGYRDPNGYWTGVTARARVLIVNTERVPDPSEINSMDLFFDEGYPGRAIGIANPLFGTTLTHAAAIYQQLGADAAQDYFQALYERGVQVLDGNSVVRDLVASGDLVFGLTDTDDACGALKRGDPVAVILPDQNGKGTMLIPSTVALIAGAPHPENGRALIDYLLLADTEQALLDAGFSHIPLHAELKADSACITTQSIRTMEIDYLEVYQHFEEIQSDLRTIFLR
jgi:iron(III) transport system substrate-binding protein